MEVPELRWETSVFQDPDGGSAILWPYLPCVRMPMKMRPREWDALALLSSSDELISLREEEEQDKESPGGHLESATASGTTLGMLVRDLSELQLEGPAIPDPERIRLLRHAENSRGGMPIYSIEPGIDDQKWADWQSRWADEQVRFRNLIATFGRNRRWAKTRIKAISRIQKPPFAIPNDLGAAAAVCAAWWAEEFISLTPELSRERNERYASRIRGAISNLRESADGDWGVGGPSLLIPVQQCYLPSLEDSLIACGSVEMLERE